MGLIILLIGLNPVLAHPHIWVDARMTLTFNDSGALTTIGHVWAFDEAFSSWAVTGLDLDGDGAVSPAEMVELGADYVDGLGEYDYFTFAGEGDVDFKLAAIGTPEMRIEDGRVVMQFDLGLEQPRAIGDAFEIAVMDTEWYVALDLVSDNPVSLINAPDGCGTRTIPPVQVSAEVENRLLGLGPDVTQLPPDLRAQLREAGQRIVLRCDGLLVAETTLQAIDQATPVVRSAPFSAPPGEAGLPVPRTGMFGWIYEAQRTFYQALTRALGDLRTDGNAFWVLGTLSFLYGIFHAAGPGHGKVVISSYVLATEKQVMRGVAMSFASAMVQAVVAVLFVSVLALALGLTSGAMSGAATWMTMGSYGLVVLMGVWLVVRKLFGWGGYDHHGHDPDDTMQVPRGHKSAANAHDHGHHHAVTPEQTGGSLRDAIGVVLAVGLRPCSGALVVLVFALSAGVFAAGIASAFLMALGTALTVSVLATLALVIKQGSLRLSGTGSLLASRVIWWVELLGAFAVLGFGVILLIAMF